MSIEKMKKVSICGLKNQKDDITYLLQRMGVMEITDVVQDNDENSIEKLTDPQLLSMQNKLNSIDAALEFMKPFAPKKKGLAKPEYTLTQINEVGEDTGKLDGILKSVDDVQKNEAEIKAEISNNDKIIEAMKPFETVPVALEDIGASQYSTSLLGLIPYRSANLVNEAVAPFSCQVDNISQDKEYAYLFVVAYNEDVNDVVNELRNLGFAQIDMSSYQGKPVDIINGCKKEISTLEAKLEECKKQLEAIGNENQFLKLSSDYYGLQVQKLEGEGKSAETDYTFVLEGWAKARDVDSLEKSVANLSDSCYVTSRDPLDDERFPTALRNNKIIQPYEAVTDLYSPPDPRGFDPNTMMAPFFFIFFGMMVSDAGYGIFLIVASFLALKLMKPEEGMLKKIIKVVFMGGISTLIWGALFGGWFALTAPNGGSFAILFEPMKQPMPMLILCYALGAIQIFTGYFVAAYVSFRDGDWKGAIFDQLFWVALYFGLTLLIVGAVIGMSILVTVGQWLAIGGAVGLILTQGRAKKNPISKLISGVLSLYNASGFLSDILSYSRLFALGLATGVVGMVINTIVGMTFSNVFLMPIGIVVFVGGHIFNIFINALGAYVHASRLQYIEYYGKFYQDGGEPFKPLRLKTKHIRLS